MEDEAMPQDKTPKEAASYLGYSVWTVYRLIRTGQLESFRLTENGQLLIQRKVLVAFREKAITNARKEHHG